MDSSSTNWPEDSGWRPTPAALDEARSHLAGIDELPVSERASVLAMVNELLVAELAAMDDT